MNLTLLQKQPWLIEPEALEAIFQANRAFISEPQPSQTPPDSSLLHIEDGIGVISISGPMLRKPDLFERVFLGACDTHEARAAIEEAAAREDIQAIFLDIDSPGGSVAGTPELAQAVARASKQKYVYAFTSGQMCSAAYWVASQADAIYATAGARIGSIGVILPLIDSSDAFAKAGLKVEIFAAGKFKSTGTPGTSLSDEQRDWLRAEVEETFSEFRSAVLARGRKIPDEAMEGQTFSARRAQRFNLAGMIESRAEALARLRKLHVRPVDTASRAMTTAPSIETELAEARQSIDGLKLEAQAREALLNDAQSEISRLLERIEVAESEKRIESQALAETRSDLEAARNQASELKAAQTQLQSELAEAHKAIADLQAIERDVEKRAALRAAQIIAETGTPAPAQVTAAGDAQTDDLLARFRAIASPAEQTAFWQQLTPAQQAQILAASSQS